MLTKITITVPGLGDNKKNLEVEGALAVGEKATVTLVGIPSGTTTDGTELRLRVLGPMGEDLATHGDWTIGSDGEYTTDLDLATLQAYRLFVPPPPPPPPPRAVPVGYQPVRPAAPNRMNVWLLVELREPNGGDMSMIGIAERPLCYWPTDWKTATLIDLADGRVYSKEEVDELLAGKANAQHTHVQADIAGLGDALAGKADLVGGKVPASQLPETIGAVSSVNGKTGEVVLSAADVGAATPSDIPAVPVKAVKRNGTALTPDANGAVNVEVPTVPTLPLSVANGGTGATTAEAARVNLCAMDATATGENIIAGGNVGSISITAALLQLDNDLSNKQDTISDLDAIRSGASVGATAVQPSELGTAASKDAPSSGNASATQVVMGNDSRLSDARTPKSHIHRLDYSNDIYTGQPDGTMFKANNKGDVVPAVAGTDYVVPSGLANYVQKSQTAGLLKNDGTVDTNQYLTQHQDISGKLDANKRNLLDYTSGTTLALGTAVYRSALNADGTFPTVDATGIPTATSYYQFELELDVPSTVPSTITGPSGWTWIDGHGLPDPADLSGGETIYISVRLDCTARTFLASVWRVA